MPSTDDTADDAGYVTTFDPAEDEQPSEAIVTAVATVADEDPLELSPLYEVVEASALDALVQHAHRKNAGMHEVWFSYEGYDVGVRTDGQIRVVGTDTADASA